MLLGDLLRQWIIKLTLTTTNINKDSAQPFLFVTTSTVAAAAADDAVGAGGGVMVFTLFLTLS